MIDLHPTKCNLCGGKVIYTSNSVVYGKEYGSGYCYYCTECKAFVGTHEPRPHEALGILANEEIRKLRKVAHRMFDIKLNGTRSQRYKWLARAMSIPQETCHFGYMDAKELRKAIKCMEELK